METKTITIQTSRLTLRRLRIEDVEAIYFKLKSDDRVTDNLARGHENIGETKTMVEEIISQYDKPYFFNWGIELNEGKELIGLIDLYNFDANEMKCCVGYEFGYNWWNKGFGTEALKAVLDFAFNRVGAKEVTATHNTDNPASGRIMEKAGMQKDHIEEAMITNAKGQIKDCAIYVINGL